MFDEPLGLWAATLLLPGFALFAAVARRRGRSGWYGVLLAIPGVGLAIRLYSEEESPLRQSIRRFGDER